MPFPPCLFSGIIVVEKAPKSGSCSPILFSGNHFKSVNMRQCYEIWHRVIGTQITWNIEITEKNLVSRNCAIGRKGDVYFVLTNSHRTPVPLPLLCYLAMKDALCSISKYGT